MVPTKRLSTSALILLSLLLPTWVAEADIPNAHQVQGVERIKQLTNYCGPACLASVMRFHGADVTQESIGKVIYDAIGRATNGADMLLYGREHGFAAYSWNTSIRDVKTKLAAGLPVVVLQQNSITDASGHYRVLTGYDDARAEFSVVDPYYDGITRLSYTDCDRLWKKMGYWALLVVPPSKDTFRAELDTKNPVVHMDLSTAKFKRGDFDEALKEARLALGLEPHNTYAKSMVSRIEFAMGAGAK